MAGLIDDFRAWFHGTDGNPRLLTQTEGNFLSSGFKTVFKTTTMEVGATAVKLPATADVDRQFMSIRNLDSSVTLYIGDSNTVEANDDIGVLAGWDIGPNETENIGIAAGKELWGIATSTIKIKVRELG